MRDCIAWTARLALLLGVFGATSAAAQGPLDAAAGGAPSPDEDAPREEATVGAPSTPMSAEERALEEARSLFRRGIDLTRQERWSEALAHFSQSRELVERPNTVLNIAACLQRLGRMVEAIDALEAYLEIAEPTDEARRSAAAQMMVEVRERVARLSLTVTPAEATVFVDDRRLLGAGSTREVALDPGQHVVRITAAGHEPMRFIVTSDPSASAHRDIVLEPTPEPETVVVEAQRPSVLPWVLVATSGVAAVTGAALALASIGDYDAVENPEAGARWTDIEDEFSRGARRRRTGAALSAVGAGGLAVGIIWLLGRDESEAPPVDVSVSARGVLVQGVF